MLTITLLLWLSGCATPSAAFLDGTAGGGSTSGTGTTGGGTGTSSGSGSAPGAGGTTTPGGGTGAGGAQPGGGDPGSGPVAGPGAGSGTGSGGNPGSGGGGSGGNGGGGNPGGGSGGTSGGGGTGGTGGGNPGGGTPGGGGSTGSLPKVPAYAADAFVDSIGVNTHITYTNTSYASAWPQVLSALKSLGVRHVRDGYYPWSPGDRMYGEHQQLAAAGIGCDYVMALGTSADPDQLRSFSGDAGDVESVEAPNECDAEGGVNCGGANWLHNLESYMATVLAAGKMMHVPVLAPSFTHASSFAAIGNIAPQITANNLHIYFGGRNPESRGWGSIDDEGNGYGSFAWWLDNAAIDAPGRTSVVTESGYLVNATATPYTVTQSVAAKYVPRTLLTAFQSGIQKTYLYELLDEVSSPGYGLMDTNLRPKAAFTALQNLISLTTDPGPAFTTGSLEYQIDGGDSDLRQLLLQKRDGSFLLILWLGSSGYDPATNTTISVATVPVTLQVSGEQNLQSISQFEDTGAVRTIKLAPTQSQPLIIRDQIQVIAIN